MPTKTFRLVTGTNDSRPIYLAGTFNNWEAGQENFKMHSGEAPGTYYFNYEFPESSHQIEYKYTRGGWEGVELQPDGQSTFNHVRDVHHEWLEPDRVARWAMENLSFETQHLPIIEVISEHFEMPQLIRTRRIAALLPHDYNESNKHYPVLYLQDGQNLFDDYAPYGSWGVDKQLAKMKAAGYGDIIIIAIDHAQQDRISEFNPTNNTKLGRGDGRRYMRFLVETLKPYIDTHYRTLAGPQHTGIGGSSLGGLISIYAGMYYPRVYDRLMIFSPALWVTPNIPFHLLKLTTKFRGRIYLYGGAAESVNMVNNIMRFKEQLLTQTKSNRVIFRTEIDPLGQHNEARWGVEFPKAVKWLFFSHQS